MGGTKSMLKRTLVSAICESNHIQFITIGSMSRISAEMSHVANHLTGMSRIANHSWMQRGQEGGETLEMGGTKSMLKRTLVSAICESNHIQFITMRLMLFAIRLIPVR